MATDETPTVWSTQERIAAYLRDGVLTGEYPPGSKLPSGRALHAQFGAAPQTIRNAISTLEREGLVYTQHGRGVMANPQRMRTMRPARYKAPAPEGQAYSWLTAAESDGMRGRIELREVKHVQPAAFVRRGLELDDDITEVVRRVQVLYLDEEPCELVESFLPVSIAAGTLLAEKRKIRGGTPRLLEDLGYPTVRCVDRVSARWPTPEQAEALRSATRDPVLRTERVTYSTGDLPVQLDVMAKAGLRYQLEYEF